MLCFAATSVATLYHYVFDWPAPYDLTTLPKLLGVIGGVSLAVGTAGLWRLNLRRHPDHGDAAQKPMDRGFIALLFLVSVTGLLLWLLGQTAAMPLMLAVHLGAVMALFLTLPYGKFAHGIFRISQAAGLGQALAEWITPPPRHTSPSYNTALWPGVTAHWGSLNESSKPDDPSGVPSACRLQGASVCR
jgi:hypothetical protein